MIADDTPIIPRALAETLAGNMPELAGRPIAPVVDHLVYRAEVAYAHAPDFRERVQNPTMRYARAQSFLRAMMRGWAQDWIKEHACKR